MDRRAFVGSSDAPAIVGLSKWTSPVQLWLEKVGLAPPREDNIAMELGRFLEPFVLSKFEEYMDEKVQDRQVVLSDPVRSWRVAHIDGRFDGHQIVEAKTAGMVFLSSNHGWGDPGTDEVPDPYIVQAQHILSLDPEAEVVWVPVLLRGVFAVYRISRNEEIIKSLISAEEEFWGMVQSGTRPEARSVDDLKALFPTSTERQIVATKEIIDDLVNLKGVQDGIKNLEKLEEDIKFRILSKMEDADTLILDPDGKTLATWKTQHRKAYSVKESQSRVFRPKFKNMED